jgi:hypothetical protein
MMGASLHSAACLIGEEVGGFDLGAGLAAGGRGTKREAT